MISILRRVLFVKANFFPRFLVNCRAATRFMDMLVPLYWYLPVERGEIALRLYNSMEYPEIP